MDTLHGISGLSSSKEIYHAWNHQDCLATLVTENREKFGYQKKETAS